MTMASSTPDLPAIRRQVDENRYHDDHIGIGGSNSDGVQRDTKRARLQSTTPDHIASYSQTFYRESAHAPPSIGSSDFPADYAAREAARMARLDTETRGLNYEELYSFYYSALTEFVQKVDRNEAIHQKERLGLPLDSTGNISHSPTARGVNLSTNWEEGQLKLTIKSTSFATFAPNITPADSVATNLSSNRISHNQAVAEPELKPEDDANVKLEPEDESDRTPCNQSAAEHELKSEDDAKVKLEPDDADDDANVKLDSENEPDDEQEDEPDFEQEDEGDFELDRESDHELLAEVAADALGTLLDDMATFSNGLSDVSVKDEPEAESEPTDSRSPSTVIKDEPPLSTHSDGESNNELDPSSQRPNTARRNGTITSVATPHHQANTNTPASDPQPTPLRTTNGGPTTIRSVNAGHTFAQTVATMTRQGPGPGYQLKFTARGFATPEDIGNSLHAVHVATKLEEARAGNGSSYEELLQAVNNHIELARSDQRGLHIWRALENARTTTRSTYEELSQVLTHLVGLQSNGQGDNN